MSRCARGISLNYIRLLFLLLSSISIVLAMPKNLIIDTDLFSDVEWVTSTSQKLTIC